MNRLNDLPLEERKHVLNTRLSYWRDVMRMVRNIEELGLNPDDATGRTQYSELFDDLGDIALVKQVLGVVHSIAFKKERYLERLGGAVSVLLEADAEREAEHV